MRGRGYALFGVGAAAAPALWWSVAPALPSPWVALAPLLTGAAALILAHGTMGDESRVRPASALTGGFGAGSLVCAMLLGLVLAVLRGLT